MPKATHQTPSQSGPGVPGLRAVWRAAVWFNWFWPHSLAREAGGCWRAHGPRGRRRLRWKAIWAVSRVLGLLPSRLGPGRWYHACRCGPAIFWWWRGVLPAAVAWLTPTRPVRLSGELALPGRRLLLAWRRRLPVGAISALFMGVTAVASPNLTHSGAGELFTARLESVSGATETPPSDPDQQPLQTLEELGGPANMAQAADGLSGPAAPGFGNPGPGQTIGDTGSGLPAPDLFAGNDLISPLGGGLDGVLSGGSGPEALPSGGNPDAPPPSPDLSPPLAGAGGLDGVLPMSMRGGGSGGSGGGSPVGSGGPTGGGVTDPLPNPDPPFTAPPVDPPVGPPTGPLVTPLPPAPTAGPIDPVATDPGDTVLPPNGGGGDPQTGRGPSGGGDLPSPPPELTPKDPADGPGKGPDTDGSTGGPGGQSVGQAIPEPAAWFSLLLGFGLLGAALRRHQAPGFRPQSEASHHGLRSAGAPP